VIDENKLIEFLQGKKYLQIDENSTEMTWEYEQEHAWELSRNKFIESVIREIEQMKVNTNDYNSVNISIGDKRFCVVNDYPKYIVKEGTCKKISKHNDNSTKYTFKMSNYGTYTFVASSFGKKVFEDKESAESVANKLNEKR
jgi:hypothetical protein